MGPPGTGAGQSESLPAWIRDGSALNQNLSPLIELQKLDLRILEITNQRRKIPERLHAVEAPLREAKQWLQDTSAAVDASVKERRSHEKDVEAQDAHTDKMRARLSELKTNKEYQAHLFELQMANKKKSEIEDKVLACMEKIEQLQKTAKEAQEKVEVAAQAFTREKQMLDELDRKLSGELAELESQQRDRSALVDPTLLARYAKLKASRKDQPLAAIKRGMCEGCRLQIPPQLVAEVKRSQDLHTCPYCHRMLYWDGETQADQKPVDQARASDLEVGDSV